MKQVLNQRYVKIPKGGKFMANENQSLFPRFELVILYFFLQST
jgi:hypothetical protein